MKLCNKIQVSKVMQVIGKEVNMQHETRRMTTVMLHMIMQPTP